jgi:microcystin-dependent protein
MALWPAAAAPTCWLLCNGQMVAKSEYPALWALLGETWGAATETHFYLPDLRGRAPVGVSPGSLEGRPTERVLAEVGGEEKHQLITDEMPNHAHGNYTLGSAPVRAGDPLCAGGTNEYGASDSEHSHEISPEGGDVAHENMQPFAVVNYIIKT